MYIYVYISMCTYLCICKWVKGKRVRVEKGERGSRCVEEGGGGGGGGE